MQVTVIGKTLEVEAAVSDTLPVDVLLDIDVKELLELLNHQVKREQVNLVQCMAVVT